jgi:hypothetical protein
MMDDAQQMIDAVKEKLTKTPQGAKVMEELDKIERLQRDLKSVGILENHDIPVRAPYSSMPVLGSRRWG